MNNFGVGAMFIYRKYLGVQHRINDTRTLSVQVHRPGRVHGGLRQRDLRRVELYRASTTSAPPTRTAIRLDEQHQYNTYKGLELTARKRLSNHWMMSGSYVYNQATELQHAGAEPGLSRSDQPFPDRLTSSGYENGTPQRPACLQAVGDVPVPVRHHGVGVLQRAFELPVQHLRPGPVRTGTQDNVNILLRPINTERLPAVKTLDLNFDKSIRLGGGRRITLNAAIFNIANSNTVLDYASGATVSTISVPAEHVDGELLQHDRRAARHAVRCAGELLRWRRDLGIEV